MKKVKFALIKMMAIIPLLLFLSVCSPLEDESKSNSILIILSLMGTDIEGTAANFLQSDVVIVDSTTGAETVKADVAEATLTAKHIEPVAPKIGTSLYNSIMLTRYVVSYTRSDKPNAIQGVDVPYSFEGSLSTLIEIDSTETISFVIVREVAKLEAPLINLRQGGAEHVLQVTANVDFYGHDLANNSVKATSTGKLSIFFANYVDK
jgi:hypothetical protein